MTTADLLEAWREATRAAELAQRLAQLANETAAQLEKDAVASEDLALMAERTAEAAEAAAKSARAAADELSARARASRDLRARDAEQTVADARKLETEAQEQYDRAESGARARHAEDLTNRPG